jgi:hypothetical protein
MVRRAYLAAQLATDAFGSSEFQSFHAAHTSLQNNSNKKSKEKYASTYILCANGRLENHSSNPIVSSGNLP